MKSISNIIATAALGLALAATVSSCEDHKELVIYEGELPIKTSTLYMVGDATPGGWSLDVATPLTAGEEDALIFGWEGQLRAGEVKLCLSNASWDVPFIRPVTNGTEISSTDITDAAFAMHAGDPDDKWKVTEAGKYRLTFNLRNHTMSTVYLGGAEAPVIVPIEAENVYIVGDATPNGWNIDQAYEMTRESQYVFAYEGVLKAGELKATTDRSKGWDVEFIRPTSEGVEIGRNGVAADDFEYTMAPDNKWKVTETGKYRLVFDLENWKVSAEYLGEAEPEEPEQPEVPAGTPIETETLFMIGDATPGGWSMDDATAFTADASNKYLFSWEGHLNTGSMKACTVQDGTFSCPFLRPATDGVTISAEGVAEPGFIYTAGDPDNKWNVTEAGTYRISFDLEHYTITVVKAGTEEPEQPENPEQPEDELMAATTFHIIGDATPGGWSMDNLTALTATAEKPHVFSWTGELKTGSMKACVASDGTFSCPFARPATDGVTISAAGVADPGFIYTAGDPDNKWNVTEAGTYTITFDLENRTISAVKVG